MTETILIWGAGAIGGTVGAYLARAGHDVLLVDQDADHVAAMADGLQIEGPIAAFTQAVRATTPELVAGVFTRVLLCVKAHHTELATRQLQAHVAEDGAVVSLQNGLNEWVIGAIIGMDRTIGAFINFGADYLAPGRILYGGRGACVLGEIGGTMTPRLRSLHRLLQDFEPDAVVTDNITAYLWGKLGYGALLFATALTDDAIADVLDDATHRDALTRLGGEVMAVAAAKAIHPVGFNGFDPSAFAEGADPAASFDAMVAFNRRSAKTHSGIWRDLAVRHRPTEVDAQLGPIIDAAAEQGVPVPLLARVRTMIHQIERGERPLDRHNLLELAA